MTETTEPTTDEPVSGRCQACGTVIAGVNQTEYDRTFAGHVLNEHADQAPDSVLDEAREVLDTQEES